MERYRFATFERDGKGEVLDIDGSTAFVQEMVGRYWETNQKIIQGFVLPRVNYACANLSDGQFKLFCSQIPCSVQADSAGVLTLEIIHQEKSDASPKLTEWNEPLNEFRDEVRDAIGRLWRISELVWESILPVLEDARLALEADYFDLFCAECGVYNEVDENGEIFFEPMPPPNINNVIYSASAVAA